MNELYLMHHGVKGQKWGVRRYQNYDGTLKSKYKAVMRNVYLKKKQRSDNNKAYAKKYGKNSAEFQKNMVGERGISRIYENEKSGDSHKKALAKEYARQVATGVALSAGMMALSFPVESAYVAGKIAKAGVTGVAKGGQAAYKFHQSSKTANAVRNIVRGYKYVDGSKIDPSKFVVPVRKLLTA